MALLPEKKKFLLLPTGVALTGVVLAARSGPFQLLSYVVCNMRDVEAGHDAFDRVLSRDICYQGTKRQISMAACQEGATSCCTLCMRTETKLCVQSWAQSSL